MSLEYKSLIDKLHIINASNSNLEDIYQEMSEEYRTHVRLDVFLEHFSTPTPETFLWHDYEGGGVHATISPSTQFAAIRTDKDFNLVDIPINLFCKPPIDNLIHPEAALLTGLSPAMLLEEGMLEHDYFAQIYNEMMIPNTCVVGYNSLSYDDEMTRAGFYRNLFPMYKREFSNRNSRWDIFPVLMAYFAIRPDGIVFPKDEQGIPSLKLEALAKANGITQDSAHNALDDCFALVGLCKLLKQCNSNLWDYLYSRRSKRTIIEDANQAIRKNQPMLHITGYAGKENYCMQVIKPIGFSQANNGNNTLIAIKLDETLADWTKLSLEDAQRYLYCSKDELASLNIHRPGIVSIKVNQCPILLSASLTNEPVIAKRLGFQSPLAIKIAQWSSLMEQGSTLARGILNKNNTFPFPPYIDTALYSYGFPSRHDELIMEENTSFDGETYKNTYRQYEAPHLQDLHIRKLITLDCINVDPKILERYQEMARERVLNPKDERASIEEVKGFLSNFRANNEKESQLIDGYKLYLAHVCKTLNIRT